MKSCEGVGVSLKIDFCQKAIFEPILVEVHDSAREKESPAGSSFQFP